MNKRTWRCEVCGRTETTTDDLGAMGLWCANDHTPRQAWRLVEQNDTASVPRTSCGKPYPGGFCRLNRNHAGQCQE